MIRDEFDILGAVSRFEADRVASEFLDWFRRGRENGTIMMMDDEDIIR
jgi:hypothetical protein